jgi:hypothetical protein
VTNEKCADYVILDLNLPEMSDLEMQKASRSKGGACHPIHHGLSERAGAEACNRKPALLMDAVKMSLAATKSGQAAGRHCLVPNTHQITDRSTADTPRAGNREDNPSNSRGGNKSSRY